MKYRKRSESRQSGINKRNNENGESAKAAAAWRKWRRKIKWQCNGKISIIESYQRRRKSAII
jgi:hypothetical protein